MCMTMHASNILLYVTVPTIKGVTVLGFVRVTTGYMKNMVCLFGL